MEHNKNTKNTQDPPKKEIIISGTLLCKSQVPYYKVAPQVTGPEL